MLQRFDETVKAVHPGTLETIQILDRIAAGKTCLCNLCSWYGDRFAGEEGNEICPKCGSDPAARTLWRTVADLHLWSRGLTALALNSHPSLRRIWSRKFRAITIDAEDSKLALEFCRAAGPAAMETRDDAPDRFPAAEPAVLQMPLDVVYLNGMVGREVQSDQNLIELISGRLTPAAEVFVRPAVVEENIEWDDRIDALFREHGFRLEAEIRFASTAVRFDWVPLFRYRFGVR